MQTYADQLNVVQTLTGELQLKLVNRNFLTENGSPDPITAAKCQELRPQVENLYSQALELVRHAESVLLHTSFNQSPIDTRPMVQELFTLVETIERLCRFLRSERRIAAKFGPALTRAISHLH
jgi:hypothetical protein